jgi:ribosomal RNA-processing protein 36
MSSYRNKMRKERGNDSSIDEEESRMRRRIEAFDEASSGSEDDENEQGDTSSNAEEGSEEEYEGMESNEYDDDEEIVSARSVSARSLSTDETNVPLFQRVAGQQQAQEEKARVVSSKDLSEGKKTSARAKKRQERHRQRELEEGKVSTEKRRPQDNRIGIKHRANKNLPSEMSSTRPVSRFREVHVDPSEKRKRAVDPRFSDLNGKLNEKIFHKTYEFLDGYQEDEIRKLERAQKKMKSQDTKEVLKAELDERKQQMKDRRRKLAVQARLDDMKTKEKEKVAGGKKPFFLKRGAQKEIALEETYKDLKSSGGLKKYMAKKRMKNAQKDKRWMPSARGGED